MQNTSLWSPSVGENPKTDHLRSSPINPNKHFPEDDIKYDTKTKQVGNVSQSTALQSIDDDDDDDDVVISRFFEYLPSSSQL